MPPNDPLFDNTPAPVAPAPPEPDLGSTGMPEGGLTNGTPNGEVNEPGGGNLSLNDIQSAVQTALQPYQDRVANLEAENRQLREATTTMVPDPDPVPEGDFYSRMAADPEAAIGAIVKDQFKTLAPLISNLHTTAHQAHVAGHANEIDTQFGAGTWREEFAPVLEARFAEMGRNDPTSIISPDIIQREVSALKGHKFDTLIERRDASRTSAAEAAEKEREDLTAHIVNSTGMVGGVRAGGGRTRELTQDEKDYVSLRAGATGETVDPHALRANMDLRGTGASGGTSLEAWRAAKAAKEGK
jgi:hypothetical protein